jgi:hypothetical protein
MRKKTIFTLIIINLCSASQAQTKLNTSPAYDNVNYGHSTWQPTNQMLDAMQQKSNNTQNKAALSGNKNKITLNNHTPYQQKKYLKKYTFKKIYKKQ